MDMIWSRKQKEGVWSIEGCGLGEEDSSSLLVGVSHLLSTADGRTGDGGRGQAGLLVDLNASFLFFAASSCLWLVLVMVCFKGGVGVLVESAGVAECVRVVAG